MAVLRSERLDVSRSGCAALGIHCDCKAAFHLTRSKLDSKEYSPKMRNEETYTTMATNLARLLHAMERDGAESEKQFGIGI